MNRITSSPWGTPDSQENVAEGIAFIETPSHGGFYLSPLRNARVPQEWREASFNRQGLSGWYEEDCDAALVVVTFPEFFSADAVRRAQLMIDAWLKPKLEAARASRAVAYSYIQHAMQGRG